MVQHMPTPSSRQPSIPSRMESRVPFFGGAPVQAAQPGQLILLRGQVFLPDLVDFHLLLGGIVVKKTFVSLFHYRGSFHLDWAAAARSCRVEWTII